MNALFVYDPADLEGAIPGGVQLCSREFLAVVAAGADAVVKCPVQVTRAPVWRLRRKLNLGSYLFYNPAEELPRIRAAAADFAPSHIFLNRSELLRLAPGIKAAFPGAIVVLMSHGNTSGDDLFEVAGAGGRRSRGWARLKATWQLGFDIVTESQFRHFGLDGVCAMSAEEETLERWLGARQTVVLPRIVEPEVLPWDPILGRVGYVGTLDHTPNRVALERLCTQLEAAGATDLEVRLVGGPVAAGEELARKYRCLHYCGRLDDAALVAEASSWSLFLNPIFWLSRGASMKLGKALAWGIPTLTTKAGARGYELDPKLVFTTRDTPEEFASQLTVLVRDVAELRAARKRLLAAENLSPTAKMLAERLRVFR